MSPRRSPKREAILKAAVAAIARNGARGLRIEQIAEEADVSQGLIYYHFTDRAGLLEGTFAHLDSVLSRTNDAARERGATARERLELGLLAELDRGGVADEYTAAWNELRASAVFDPALQEPLREWTRLWVGQVAEEIRAVAPEDVDALAAATRLTALIEGLGLRVLAGWGGNGEEAAQLRAAIAVELRG